MGGCLDYLAWRGDLSLKQAPFCAVDALILSVLSYVRLVYWSKNSFCASRLFS